MSEILSGLGQARAMLLYVLEYGRGVIPPVLLAGVIYLAVSTLRNWKRGLRVPPVRKGVMLLFVCYCAGMAALTLTPPNLWFVLEVGLRWGLWPEPEWWARLLGQGGFDFEPALASLLLGRESFRGWSDVIDVCNILLFVPMGFLPPLLWRKLASWRGFALGVGISLGIELLQPIIGRSCDIDDLLANAAGAAIGLGLCLLLGWLIPGFVAKAREKARPAQHAPAEGGTTGA